MKNIKKFQGWRSEQIVKVFLLNSGLLSLTENFLNIDSGIDFIGFYIENPNIRYGIEIKATKYSKNEIETKYPLSQISLNFPVIYFYINYDIENGYFRFWNNKTQTPLTKMDKEKFNLELKNYAQQR